MKNLTKPISSPGRTEKFPPPLMRFLRSNVGNKSHRRRSRASPMFIKKKNTVINTTQEPSSPKVTCIGQVRVRRSKKNKTTTVAAVHRRNRFCRCVRKIKPRSFFTVLSKWVLFFRCEYCKNSCFFTASPEIIAGNNGEEKKQEKEQEKKQERGTVEKDEVNEDLVSQPPPKNALLLTRCRSAPYRSSSLANKLLESTDEKTGEDEFIEKIKKMEIKNEEEEDENEELNGVKEVPLILSRCKSEPARTWDQILV